MRLSEVIAFVREAWELAKAFLFLPALTAVGFLVMVLFFGGQKSRGKPVRCGEYVRVDTVWSGTWRGRGDFATFKEDPPGTARIIEIDTVTSTRWC